MTMTSVADPVATGGGSARRSSHQVAQRRRLYIALGFLAPALVLLGVLVVYPVIYSIWRSLYDAVGSDFIGLANYQTMFTDPATFRAIRNNVIWVVVAPITVTILGLIFAVLMDRIKWSAAFKLIVFMPMAISMVAAGVIFRTAFQENPQLGLVNATLVKVDQVFTGGGSSYPGARPREDVATQAEGGVINSAQQIQPGNTQNFPLVAIKPEDVPSSAQDAVEPAAAGPDAIGGVVWLDFVRGGGGTNGQVGDGKKGLPDVTVEAVDSSGAVVGTAETADNGTYLIDGLSPGSYTVRLPADNFKPPFDGVPWLGPSLVTAVVILSYIWIWAGFAMVMIASGLSAMDRSLQEAARVDGASEWQVFRRITAPLLSPVLVVVFITLIVNVLKIFDLVYVIPPGASLPQATVIAVQMWTVSFGGGANQGLGSALAVLLLILVLPFMIINVRRFRLERER